MAQMRCVNERGAKFDNYGGAGATFVDYKET